MRTYITLIYKTLSVKPLPSQKKAISLRPLLRDSSIFKSFIKLINIYGNRYYEIVAYSNHLLN